MTNDGHYVRDANGVLYWRRGWLCVKVYVRPERGLSIWERRKIMRQNEITDELIRLSKRAKELGFPQDVEVGDWLYVIDYYNGPQTILMENTLFKDRECIHSLSDDSVFQEWWKVLSFSTCLAWLETKNLHIDIEINGAVTISWRSREPGDDWKNIDSETHHEAICKCVIKVLEAQDE